MSLIIINSFSLNAHYLCIHTPTNFSLIHQLLIISLSLIYSFLVILCDNLCSKLFNHQTNLYNFRVIHIIEIYVMVTLSLFTIAFIFHPMLYLFHFYCNALIPFTLWRIFPETMRKMNKCGRDNVSCGKFGAHFW